MDGKKIKKQSSLTHEQATQLAKAFHNSPGMQRLRKYFTEGHPTGSTVLHVSPEGP